MHIIGFCNLQHARKKYFQVFFSDLGLEISPRLESVGCNKTPKVINLQLSYFEHGLNDIYTIFTVQI